MTQIDERYDTTQEAGTEPTIELAPFINNGTDSSVWIESARAWQTGQSNDEFAANEVDNLKQRMQAELGRIARTMSELREAMNVQSKTRQEHAEMQALINQKNQETRDAELAYRSGVASINAEHDRQISELNHRIALNQGKQQELVEAIRVARREISNLDEQTSTPEKIPGYAGAGSDDLNDQIARANIEWGGDMDGYGRAAVSPISVLDSSKRYSLVDQIKHHNIDIGTLTEEHRDLEDEKVQVEKERELKLSQLLKEWNAYVGTRRMHLAEVEDILREVDTRLALANAAVHEKSRVVQSIEFARILPTEARRAVIDFEDTVMIPDQRGV